MSGRLFLSVLGDRWRLVVSVWAIVVGLTVVYVSMAPRKYVATAAVLVDMRFPDPLGGGGTTPSLMAGYMSTQMDVVLSERVALRAISALGWEHDEALRQDWLRETQGQGDFRLWLANELLSGLDVQPTRDSGVMSVSYKTTDPLSAAAAANAMMQAYIDTTLELRVEPAKSYNTFFVERARNLRENLESAQARLSSYQQANGLIASDERLDVETTRLNELSSQLVALQAATTDSGSRQLAASRNVQNMAEVTMNPLLSNLNAEIARQRQRLGELQQRLGEQHPQVLQAQAGIAQLETQLRSETRRVSTGVNVSNEINKDRLTRLRSLVEEQRSKVLRLKGTRDQATVLQRDVDNARNAYDAVQLRASQAGLESQNTQTNVSVLKRAAPPLWPASPHSRQNLAVAAVLGALLAVAAALAREATDRRLRAAEDVAQLFNQPLMVVLPRGGSRRGFADSKAMRWVDAPVLADLAANPRRSSRRSEPQEST